MIVMNLKNFYKPKMNYKGIIGKFILATFISYLTGVRGIQNEPTPSRISSGETVFSASSLTPAKASSFVSFPDLDDNSQEKFASTHPAIKLESSKNLENYSEKFTLETLKNQDSPSYGTMTSSKNIQHIEENNIEVKPPEYLENLVSTEAELSGEGQGAPQGQIIVAEPHHHQYGSSPPRQGRQGSHQMIYNNVSLQPSVQTDVPSNRQANPDIQDIITGIVKLLNGNVNVAVNTLRPHKPIQATRINNRGPPRISDLPPLPPDFDTPGMNPPPRPFPDQPYPFETPPAPEKPSINKLSSIPERTPARPFLNGVPLPESIIPQNNRPWNRPYRPSNNNRRPIPPYKQLPSQNSSFSPDNYNNSTNIENNRTEMIEDIKKKTQKFPPPLKKDEKIDSANTLILGAEVQPIPLPSRIDNNPNKIIQHNNNSQNTKESTNPIKLHMSTLKIETSSSIQVIEPTRTTIEIQPSIVPLENNFNNSVHLESSEDHDITSTIINNNDESTSIEGFSITSSTKLSSNIIESSTDHSIIVNTYYKPSLGENNYSYRPRPGIVLDDTLDYTKSSGFATKRPYTPLRHPQIGDIFDVTVSAIQGPGGRINEPTRIGINSSPSDDIILTSAVDGQGFVSIDGKRTHLNLFENTQVPIQDSIDKHIQPSRTQAPGLIGTGYAVAQSDPQQSSTSKPYKQSNTRRPTFFRKTTTDAVRIDTCIVGDSSTCDASQHEACATVQGVSACHCKPGYARLIRTLPCKRVISIAVSIRVDKIYDSEIIWSDNLRDKNSEAHQEIVYESNRAIESAMSMTPFSDEYMGSSVNNIYHGDVSQGQGGVFVNATIRLSYESRRAKPSLAGELQKHLLGVIHRRNNNVGNSALFVTTPAGSISNLQDLDECASSEYNDCHSSAVCINTWGEFTCTCKPGLKDPHKNDPEKAGRLCISCSPSHCNNRGTCSYQANLEQCSCTGNYYGVKCEIDGEVVAVAIGASVAALVIIILTLVCLVMWSRRWSREQKAMGSPVYGYMQATIPPTLPSTLARVGSVGTLASVKQGPPSNFPPYLWGHIADHMAATANLYASEPMGGATRPSSAVFGYPTMSTLHGTLPPVPLPRLQALPRSRQRQQPEPDSSDSEPQDKDRADLIPQNNGFHAPRPKSRSSLANQSGIYYDVEYDQGDAHHLSKNNIPMSTYSMARPYYRT